MPTLWPLAYRAGFGSTLAPVLDIHVSWGARSVPLQALVDSGASTTLIPVRLVNDLGLRKIKESAVSGYDGRKERRGVYVVNLEFSGLMFLNRPVVAIPNRDYALVGRDILNSHVTTLDGPRLELSIA